MSVSFDTGTFAFDSTRLTFDGEINPSRRELLLNVLVQEFGTISKANGYRNDLAIPVSKGARGIGENNPSIIIFVGAEEFVFNDSNRQVINSEIQCEVRGYFTDLLKEGDVVTASEGAGESLLDDINRVFARLTLKYKASATSRWIVNAKRTAKTYGPSYNPTGSNGMVGILFTATILYQGVDL